MVAEEPRPAPAAVAPAAVASAPTSSASVASKTENVAVTAGAQGPQDVQIGGFQAMSIENERLKRELSRLQNVHTSTSYCD